MRRSQTGAFVSASFLALILCTGLGAPGHAQLFHPAHGVPTANGPIFITAADMDGDATPDLVVGTSLDTAPLEGYVQVLPGTGAGTFGAARTVVSEMYASFSNVLVLDADGDGDLDLLTAVSATAGKGFLGGGAVLYRGAGDGTFGSAEELVGGAYMWCPAVTAGDLNHDGHTDLCAPLYVVDNPSSIHVFLGDGAGGFVEQPAHPLWAMVTHAVLEDLDGDGSLDLALTDAAAESVWILQGQGDGTFLEFGTYGVGEEPLQMASADLNGDTHPDLVTVNNAAETVSVLLGQGDGTFLDGASYAVGGASPRALDLGDLNGDGAVDLVTANTGSDDLSALLGAGDGSFGAPEPLAAGSAPWDVTLADLNGDTHPDCIASNAGGAEVSVLLNAQGNPAPEPWGAASVTGAAAPDPVSLAANLGLLVVLPLLIAGWRRRTTR